MGLGAALRGHDNALNFLRLILASAVIFWHTYPVLGADPHWEASWAGAAAVDGFFAISGFLIAGSRMRLRFWPYIARRAARIYPAYWVALVITAFAIAPLATLLNGSAYTLADGVRYVLKNITLWIGANSVGVTLADSTSANLWNASIWTLFYEFAAYVIIGLILLVPWTRRHLTATAATLLVVTTVSAALRLPSLLPEPFATIGGNSARLWSFFAAGMLVYALKDRITTRWYVGVPAIAAVLAIHLLGADAWLSPLPIAVALLWLGAVLPVRIGARNDISYGTYIYAFPVQQLLAVLGVGAFAPPLIFSVIAVACTIPAAWLSWLLVERPVVRRVGNALKSREARSARPSPVTQH